MPKPTLLTDAKLRFAQHDAVKRERLSSNLDISILWLRSFATGREFPTARFSADTDMVTDGWTSLTSIERPEVVVVMATPEESSRDASALRQLEKRINGKLNRIDLRAVTLVRVEENVPNRPVSFQAFKDVYRPSTLFFRDLFSEGAEAAVVREASVAGFQASGGIYAVFENV